MPAGYGNDIVVGESAQHLDIVSFVEVVLYGLGYAADGKQARTVFLNQDKRYLTNHFRKLATKFAVNHYPVNSNIL